MTKIVAVILLAVVLLYPHHKVYAHKGKEHFEKKSSANKKREQPAAKSAAPENALKEIDALYAAAVKPIFKRKCFDCHGTGNPLPWYARIPGPKQFISQDIRDAKRHLDISSGFPFGGHGSPTEDLESLREVLKDGSMPPLGYKIMHWEAGLTQKEIQEVRKWIEKSLTLLKRKPAGGK